LYKGQNLYTINEGEILNSFQSLLSDFDSLTYASYLCELIDISHVEEESNRVLFKELMTAFYLMANKAVDYDLLVRAFEVKLISLTGYNFNFENCCICKRKIGTSNYLKLDELGGVCSDCERTKGVSISFAAYNSLKYLSRTSLENIYKLTLDSKVKDELYKILSEIIAENYGRAPNSLKAFNFFKGVDLNE
jgi:DNA repair protein RecO (recombination protein O)